MDVVFSFSAWTLGRSRAEVIKTLLICGFTSNPTFIHQPVFGFVTFLLVAVAFL